MKTTEVKYCPCCGGDPIVDTQQASREQTHLVFHHTIECDACGIQTLPYGTLDEALAAWNARPPLPEINNEH